MAIKTLFKAGALGPGSELWVAPSLDHSPWTKTLDWYLNLQILRSRSHTRVEISEPLANIIKWSNMNLCKVEDASSRPLLIVSHKAFPNREVVVIPEKKDKVSWMQETLRVWSSLKQPSMRVFLPDFMSESDFLEAWPGDRQSADITLVPHFSPQA